MRNLDRAATAEVTVATAERPATGGAAGATAVADRTAPPAVVVVVILAAEDTTRPGNAANLFELVSCCKRSEEAEAEARKSVLTGTLFFFC